MTVTVTGRSAVSRYLAQLPTELRKKVLRPAARVGGKVIAEEVKDRSISPEVSAAVITKTKAEADRIVVRITVKPGWPASLANWQEYGTDPHFISVDASQRQGRSVNRINTLAKEPGSSHSLVIGGKFVGETVFHPGARAHPAFRPAIDAKINEAIRATQREITSRANRLKTIGTIDEDDDQ